MIFSKLTILAQAGSGTYLDVALVRELDQLWHWAVLLLVCLLILFFIGLMYFKDSVELPAGLTCTLVVLRLCALFALFQNSFLRLLFQENAQPLANAIRWRGISYRTKMITGMGCAVVVDSPLLPTTQG